ncbi:hypothetical protein ACVGVM_17985 [Pseudonocardia bannensis]|uniref:Uncharacterized protein n=1 Tax=Pseudonocardia bannensis TaxID=630973 RepID=A0A848DQW2_9PSEU|nr:hypothetical protein [Pseudonocardia bannensis]NMH94694.1 hypothetical protein [Pseudonocardia bannensis]
MTASILVLTLIAVLAFIAVRAHRSGRRRFRPEQFRPAAPFAGLLPTDRDRERQVAELRALHDARADVHLSLR